MSRAKKRALNAIPAPTPLQSALGDLANAIEEHLSALVTFDAAIRSLDDEAAHSVAVTLFRERLRFAERAKLLDTIREHVRPYAAKGGAA